jgi:hypothetical protein
LIHGEDLARAIIAVHSSFHKAVGQRWLLTDGRVYDWWDLASAWGSAASGAMNGDSVPSESSERRESTWVQEMMAESGIRALPRDVRLLGRALDSREFWLAFGLTPLQTLL